MAFPENVRMYRERAGLSQKKLAELIGVSQQTIDRYEDGSRMPNIKDGVKLATALQTTSEELVKTLK
ncbi:MAG: helix-turn-helix domain-containing protein [Ruminococcus sp.]|nr:helix-turn-helix domain-containing protein [Ruminococcus sp.]MDE6781171.1 helix-turn-helix domain-containing protein [Ruminococcus sp.]